MAQAGHLQKRRLWVRMWVTKRGALELDMIKARIRLAVITGLLLLTVLACRTPDANPAPTHWPSQTGPTITAPASPTNGPAANESTFGGIRLTGSPEFITQTRRALALLQAKAPGAFLKIQTYVGIIAEGQHSGMWVWEVPPRYEVGDPTAFYSVTWYASTIAHDATHSELYHNGQPWEGVEVEKFCDAYQLTVLKQIDAPQNEIDYLSGLDGTQCDVDGDGDCDWNDYLNRNW